MTSPLSHGQELLLITLAILSAVYVFYFKIWLPLAIGSDILFCLALATSVASVVAPGLFETLSRSIIEQSPLPQALHRADAQIAQLASLPSDLIDKALTRIGYSSAEDVDVESSEPAVSGLVDSIDVPGPFTTAVRPSVESLVGGVLRGAGFFCGGVLMVTSLAMRSSTTTARRLRELTDRVDAIDSPTAQCKGS